MAFDYPPSWFGNGRLDRLAFDPAPAPPDWAHVTYVSPSVCPCTYTIRTRTNPTQFRWLRHVNVDCKLHAPGVRTIP